MLRLAWTKLAPLVLLGAFAIGLAAPAPAHAQDRFAAIVIDLETREVLHADEADAHRFPASLTKMMTLYMLFEALDAGQVRLEERLPVSRAASRQPPSRLGLRRGETIRVDQAIEALAARSANDVAVVVAERLGGSEARFAERMTRRANEIGLTDTRFANASGLPDQRHRTTARDMAILSEALIRDFPHYYRYFQTPSMTWRNRSGRNHNRLLGTVEGVDGIKTGYTRASRYNLAASAVRDGRRLIAVVLGGESSASRNAEMEHLLEAGFEEIARRRIEEEGGLPWGASAGSRTWRTALDWAAQADPSEGEGEGEESRAAEAAFATTAAPSEGSEGTPSEGFSEDAAPPQDPLDAPISIDPREDRGRP
jgi:D-alanyl-D-alanine carboxypeptidase